MMQSPVQIAARGIVLNPWWRDRILHKAEKLEEYCDRITHCRVVVEERHKHSHKGRLYGVRIDVEVPGGLIVVSREPDPFLNAAIERAFDAAERKLEDRFKRRVRETHHPRQAAEARVVEILPDAGYGFLETPDERRIYFHANSVLGGQFQQLTVGSLVHYTEEQGEKGPQASTVSVVKLAAPR